MGQDIAAGGDRLLTPAEVGRLFRVDPKTVARWAKAGRINRIRTPGGHGRYRESEVRALLQDKTDDDNPVPRPLRSGDRAGPPGTLPAGAADALPPGVPEMLDSGR